MYHSSAPKDVVTGEVAIKRPSRRNTDIAQEIQAKQASTTRSKWYEPGIDICLYEDARRAMRDVSTKLLDRGLKVSREDRSLLNVRTAEWLSTADGHILVQNQIRELAERQQKIEDEQSEWWKLTADFANNFCNFAYKLSGILNILVPQSPEYSITYGALIVVFKAVVGKRKQKEDLNGFILKLQQQMPLVEFYKEEVPTNSMKSIVVAIYVQIVDFLGRAVKYYTSGSVVRLVDAIFPRIEAQFEVYIANIQNSMQQMLALKDAALKAQTSDMKETVENSAYVIGQLHENVKVVASSVAVLNRKLEEAQLYAMLWNDVQIIEHANNLRSLLDPDDQDAQDEAMRYKDIKHHLSPRDGWRENGILEEIKFWAKSEENHVLWASGSCGPSHDSWVTPFALDMIDAMRSQAAPLTYVLCDANETMTAHLLCRQLICRTLDQMPSLILQDPRVFNARRFRAAAAAKSYTKIWNIFEELTMRIDCLFIVVDRIDRIFEGFEGGENDETEARGFMVKLLKLVSKALDGVRFIFTSIEPPSNYVDSDEAFAVVQDSHIDTGRRPGRKHF